MSVLHKWDANRFQSSSYEAHVTPQPGDKAEQNPVHQYSCWPSYGTLNKILAECIQ